MLENLITKKKKISIDFEQESINILEIFKKNCKLNSNSVAVNYLIHLFGYMQDDISINLANVCKELYNEKLKSIEEIELSPYEYNIKSQEIEKCKELYNFFAEGKKIQDFDDKEKKMAMKKVQINNGYVIFPSDWIELNVFAPADCKYVGVVETRNGSKYNVPHFIFYYYKPINEINDYDLDKINNACCIAYPGFETIINMDIEPAYDEHNNFLNVKEWQEAPHIGHFRIPEYGDPFYSKGNYPYGAMIMRNK